MKADVEKPPVMAMSGIIASMILIAAASGLAYAYVPIRLASLGFEPWVAASMVPSVAFGGLVGCFATGWMLRISGHARVFMVLQATFVLSYLIILISDNPIAWIVARATYGLAAHGIFIVAQSWLHDATTDELRGRVITVLYVSFLVTIGAGAYSIGYVDIESNTPMIISIFITTLAVFPIGLTKLRQPPLPEQISVEIRRVWKISPIGLLGMFCVGGMTFTLVSFAPIYAGELKFPPADIGLLMLMMQIGLLTIQLPMGVLSDKIERRRVLLIVCGMATVMALVSISAESNLSFFWLVLVFAVWAGSNDTIYSVSSALANDRADPKHYVVLASTQMVAWSSGGFIIPLIATLLLGFFPVSIFMWVLLAVTVAFGSFVVLRMLTRAPAPVDDREFVPPETAPLVHPGGLTMFSMTSGDDAGMTEGLS